VLPGGIIREWQKGIKSFCGDKQAPAPLSASARVSCNLRSGVKTIMPLTGKRTFVGFGFGAIQSGLFLYEAFQSGNFGRMVVAEVMPDAVAAVRQAGGYFAVNIAQSDRVEQAHVGPIEIVDPATPAGRAVLVTAIAEAQEIATAVPGVKFYAAAGEGSLHRLLAAGLHAKIERGLPNAVVYAAENHNEAAEILEEHVLGEIAPSEHTGVHKRVQFLNTVIGKMSGVVSDPALVTSGRFAPVTPGNQRVFLVEAFNRILISRVRLPRFRRGIAVFEEKENLLPFEEAKLYGHNATHALAAYIGALSGARYIADLRDTPGMLPFLRAAFIEESGESLIRRWKGLDPLFTPAGYTAYADDLLVRMTNPHLLDTVERVGRDPQRKLGWDDRLIGVLRTALSQGVQPRRYALGAAAALAALDPSIRTQENVDVAALLDPLWQGAHVDGAERHAVLSLIADGWRALRAWLAQGTPDLSTTGVDAFT
jgi:mannitol-1-phosphate 5-dehydrogenase